MIQTVVGGTVSEATGGKFKNGAGTAVFMYLVQWGAESLPAAESGEVDNILENSEDSELTNFINNPEFKDNFSYDKETNTVTFEANVTSSEASRKRLVGFVENVNRDYSSVDANGQKLKIHLTIVDDSNADIVVRTRDEWRRTNKRSFDKFMEKRPNTRCMVACAKQGGKLLTLGSARNSGQYAHEIFHMMGFGHEKGDASNIMYGTFSERGFKVHGVQSHHINKIKSSYGL